MHGVFEKVNAASFGIAERAWPHSLGGLLESECEDEVVKSECEQPELVSRMSYQQRMAELSRATCLQRVAELRGAMETERVAELHESVEATTQMMIRVAELRESVETGAQMMPSASAQAVLAAGHDWEAREAAFKPIFRDPDELSAKAAAFARLRSRVDVRLLRQRRCRSMSMPSASGHKGSRVRAAKSMPTGAVAARVMHASQPSQTSPDKVTTCLLYTSDAADE